MLKKTKIAILIYVIATLQVIGYGSKMWFEGSRLSHFLFLNTGLSEAFCARFSQSTVGLMVLAIVWAFFKWRAAPFFLLGAIVFLEALAKTLLGGEFASSYALAAEAARYMWLFAVAYALVVQRRLDQDKVLPLVPQLFQWSLALTFLTHGLEALQFHPRFIDLLIVASRKLTEWPLVEADARLLLMGIGIIDVACALAVVWKPRTPLLIYMALWGLVTALSRVIFNFEQGIFEALLRTAHVGLPLLILLLRNPGPLGQSRILFSPRRLFQRRRAYD